MCSALKANVFCIKYFAKKLVEDYITNYNSHNKTHPTESEKLKFSLYVLQFFKSMTPPYTWINQKNSVRYNEKPSLHGYTLLSDGKIWTSIIYLVLAEG
jgi:hypothetical protein